MSTEYLIFNFIVLIGPVLASFDRHVCFFSKWKSAWLAITIVAIPFIAWDALVTGRHWWFSPVYTIGVKIFELPVEECLFFFTVPFASVFVWEVVKHYFPFHTGKTTTVISLLVSLMWMPGIYFAFTGKEYTAFALMALSVSFFIDLFLKTTITTQKRFYTFLGLTSIFMLIFNGYLTARPVVMYDAAYQLDWRVGTIPIEDFIYGYALIVLVVVVYEKLIFRTHEIKKQPSNAARGD